LHGSRYYSGCREVFNRVNRVNMGWVLSRRWESATHAARPTKLRFYVEIAGLESGDEGASGASTGASGESGTRGCGCPSMNHYK